MGLIASTHKVVTPLDTELHIVMSYIPHQGTWHPITPRHAAPQHVTPHYITPRHTPPHHNLSSCPMYLASNAVLHRMQAVVAQSVATPENPTKKTSQPVHSSTHPSLTRRQRSHGSGRPDGARTRHDDGCREGGEHGFGEADEACRRQRAAGGHYLCTKGPGEPLQTAGAYSVCRETCSRVRQIDRDLIRSRSSTVVPNLSTSSTNLTLIPSISH